MERTGTSTVKRGLAQMLKGGVIMDVVTPEHAVVAQESGAVAVMALERIPADIRAAGGVARMSNLELVRAIMDAVTIPVMAKVRIGHFAEAQVLQQLGIDYIDESEVLTPADDKYHVDKHAFTTPFVCGARDLGEALRRIAEGAAMIRSKGEAGSGNIVEAVRHMRAINDAIRELTVVPKEELVARARDLGAPLELVAQVAAGGKLPVVLFCAGGVSTPADAAQRLAEVARAADERRLERVLVDVILVVGRCQHFGFVDIVHAELLQHLRLGEVADAHLGHHRNRHGIHDAADQIDAAHACHSARGSNVG
ncbi:MAG: hypothetical protein JO029_08725, partial [Candidatus Eremiobacteraeota bacterium]|nr:hypothetical protein [Candidatus Eremiobacteraeota bacterium]